MAKNFESVEEAYEYLDQFLKIEEEMLKLGVYRDFKVDFVNGSLKIISGKYGYYVIFFFKIGKIGHQYDSRHFKEFNKLIEHIKTFKNDYTLNMDSFRMVPKEDYYKKLTFRNAISKIFNVEYDQCYVCLGNSANSLKTPCQHSICSECYYRSIGFNNIFKCGVCRKMFAKAGSTKMKEYNADEDDDDYEDDDDDYDEDFN